MGRQAVPCSSSSTPSLLGASSCSALGPIEASAAPPRYVANFLTMFENLPECELVQTYSLKAELITASAVPVWRPAVSLSASSIVSTLLQTTGRVEVPFFVFSKDLVPLQRFAGQGCGYLVNPVIEVLFPLGSPICGDPLSFLPPDGSAHVRAAQVTPDRALVGQNGLWHQLMFFADACTVFTASEMDFFQPPGLLTTGNQECSPVLYDTAELRFRPWDGAPVAAQSSQLLSQQISHVNDLLSLLHKCEQACFDTLMVVGDGFVGLGTGAVAEERVLPSTTESMHSAPYLEPAVHLDVPTTGQFVCSPCDPPVQPTSDVCTGPPLLIPATASDLLVPHHVAASPDSKSSHPCECLVVLESVLQSVCSRGVKAAMSVNGEVIDAVRALHREDDLCVVHSPWNVTRWGEAMLARHDTQDAAFMFYGVAHGFRLTDDVSVARRSAKKNVWMCYTAEGKPAMQKRLDQRLAEGSVLRWSVCVDTHPACSGAAPLKVSPLFWVPKGDNATSEEVREILHLSAPVGNATNELPWPTGLSADMQLSSISDAVDSLEKDSWMAKEDLRWGYKNVPVHPSSLTLLGFEWDGLHYCETALPFGLDRAPAIFNQLSTAVAAEVVRLWEEEGNRKEGDHIHVYLDDFLLVTRSQVTLTLLHKLFNTTVQALGLQVNASKTELPSQCAEYLGVVLDVERWTMYLSEKKRVKLVGLLQAVLDTKRSLKRHLESLVGRLVWASQTVVGGMTFTRSLINSHVKVRAAHHLCRITLENRADLEWWIEALSVAHPKSLRAESAPVDIPHTHNRTDACTEGEGGFYNGQGWAVKYGDAWLDKHINLKELHAVMEQLLLYGEEWEGKAVQIGIDNMSTVRWLMRWRAKPPEALTLVKEIWHFCVQRDIDLRPVHVPGVDNVLADALSRQLWDVYDVALKVWHEEYGPLRITSSA